MFNDHVTLKINKQIHKHLPGGKVVFLRVIREKKRKNNIFKKIEVNNLRIRQEILEKCDTNKERI